MSESLRDQLLKAGFSAPTREQKAGSGKRKRKSGNKKSPRSGKPRSTAAGDSGEHYPPMKDLPTLEQVEQQEREKKKAVKAAIKKLIEDNRVTHTGSNAYSYQLGNRVRQLFVNDECRQKLGRGELVITRLNGNTHLVGPETGKEILDLNPDWMVIMPRENDTQDDRRDGDDDDYGDYKVPDDLIW